MPEITTAQMIKMVRNQIGCTVATIKTDTNPRVKKSCPFQNVHKISHLNVMIGFNYNNAVNNQLTRKELTTATLKHYSTSYKDEYGNNIPKDLLEDHLPKKSSVSRQGVENQIIYRDLDASSITEITMMQKNYRIRRYVRIPVHASCHSLPIRRFVFQLSSGCWDESFVPAFPAVSWEQPEDAIFP